MIIYDRTNTMKSLFDSCTSVVLGSSYLLQRASLHLPRGVSHFLLYLALESRQQLAVRKLVEKWPHGDLTLDFLTNSLCKRYRCSTRHCLEPHEYMGAFSSYARHSCYENVTGALGVFYNLYYGVQGAANGLRTVDLSAIVIDDQQSKCSY